MCIIGTFMFGMNIYKFMYDMNIYRATNATR